MQSALDSAIGLPSKSTSPFSMLALLMPLEVRRSFMVPPWELLLQAWPSKRVADPYALETRMRPRTHRLRPDPASHRGPGTLAHASGYVAASLVPTVHGANSSVRLLR